MMRKNIAVLFILIWSVAIAFAQTDSKAKALLDQVSTKYDAYRTIQSDFSFSIKQGEGADSYTDKGKLFLNKTQQQFRIQLQEQDIISDGKSTWSVLKEDQEVQVSDTDHSPESIGPSNLFTFYKNGFVYKSINNDKLGNDVLQVVELTPTDAKTNYAKIILRVNKNKHIHDVAVYDKSGSVYTYTIHALYVNHQIPTTTFTFNRANYPGFEIVDLR